MDESFLPAGMNRRRFLQLMGASIALASLESCMKQPDEKIVPYVRAPEGVIPGESLSYATAMVLDGYSYGVLATSHMGRPTKLEGNPDHPASLGSTDAFTQASILTLYDPDRSKVLTHRGEIRAWGDFVTALDAKGTRLRILTGTVTSPTLGKQLEELLRRFPGAVWHQYDPVTADAVREGALLAFRRDVNTIYRFERADVVFSLDADFLSIGPGRVRYARDFSEARRVGGGTRTMNRLYVAESTPTITGAMADHRIPLHAAAIERLARSLAARLNAPGAAQEMQGETNEEQQTWLNVVADDLLNHRGRSIVLAGIGQSPAVHAIVHAINRSLGNYGRTVIYTDPVEVRPINQMESLRGLATDMEAGNVDTLVIAGGNPVYDAPADLNFAETLSSVNLKIHLGLYEDETSARCDWHIPEAHFLEAWGDARAYDGTVSIVQPLIAPLYGGKSLPELLEAILDRSDSKGYDTVRGYWKTRTDPAKFDQFWQKSLNDGVISGTSLSPIDPELRLRPEVWESSKRNANEGQRTDNDDIELDFRPDPTIWDGAFANNAWLQELPKPLTKLTWDNAILTGSKTAGRLGLTSGDLVEVHSRGRHVTGPVLVFPGQPENVLTLPMGYGRTRAGNVGSRIGFSAYAIRTSCASWHDGGAMIRRTGEKYRLAITQEHHEMEGRHEVRSATLAEFMANPSFAREEDPPPAPSQTLYPAVKYEGYAWGMSIDLNSCIGCNACVIACQAENNIPVGGKEEVENSREMHWIRIDTYFAGSDENPAMDFQPVPCMHCENAPCELVCPVGATVHDSEGLNVMVYNRCIGTRYCSNNCPYKVRRFNFFQYGDEDSPTLKMQRNPDVSVRSRGVMEKCTYCIQRIDAARINAEKEDRPIRDGEVVTACQAACPAQAIVFGDTHNPESAVAKLKAEPREYSLLAELNTKPRTTYLAKLRNPNPALREV